MTDTASGRSPALLWAIYYCDMGLAIIPTKEGEKRPALAAWEEWQLRRPSTNQLELWWFGLYRDCGPGMITGMVSGNVFVIDVDTVEGKQGEETANDLQMMHDDLPITWQGRSGGGGKHYFFRAPPGVKIKTGKNILGLHVDVRGEGGFLVLPPTIHPCGEAYSWVPGCDPASTEIADCPDWLLPMVAEGDTNATAPEEPTAAAGNSHDGEFNAFGRRIDGREEFMRDLLWARLLDERRKGTLNLTQSLLDAILEDCWAIFEMRCKARSAAGLAADGRGKDEMRRKLRYAVKKWNGRIAAEAAQPKPAGSWADDVEWGGPSGPTPGQAQPSASPLSIRSVFPIDPTQIPPRPWLVPGLLIRNHVTVVVAPPGVGKSLLTLQISLAMGSGRQWGDWEPRRAFRVLLVNAEDDYDEMRRRMVTATNTMAIPQEEVTGKVFIADAPESIVIARTDPRSKAVIRQPRADELIEVGKAMAIDCIVVDPFAETFEGDENSNSELKWAAVLWREIARKIAGSVLLVHHTRKYASGMSGDADASRGAGALIGVARVVATMFAMTDEEAELFDVDRDERHRFVRFDSAKANLTLITGNARWFKKESAEVGNATAWLPSDDTGVLVPWSPPGLFDDVPPIRIMRALNAIDQGVLDENGVLTGTLFTRHFRQSSKRWAGVVLMDELGVEAGKASAMLKAWLNSGLIYETDYDDNKTTRKGLKVDFSKRPGAST